MVHRAGHRVAAPPAPAPRPAARRAIPDRPRPLRRHAEPLRQRGWPAHRQKASRLVLEGAPRIGGVSRRGQPDRRGAARQGAAARLLRSADRARSSVISLRHRRSAPSLATRPAAALATGGLDTAALLAALPSPVIALDRGGTITFANPAAEQFFGVSAVALIGNPLAEFIAPHSPLFTLADAVWRTGGSIAEYDLVLEGPRFSARSVTI